MRHLIPASLPELLLSVAFLVLVSPVDAMAESPVKGGDIKGKVRITEKLTEQRMRFRLYPGFRPAPPFAGQNVRSDEWRNVVIYIRSDKPLVSSALQVVHKYQMAQEGETFIPHVLPVPVDSTVEFPNQDPIFHNVFSLSGTRTFDLGRYPKGDSRSVKFDRAGIVPVFCHIHSDMSAIIMVLENDYFAVPETDGSYRIAGIPPGTYTLVAWHERTDPIEKTVEVKGGETLELNITIPIEPDENSRP